MSDQEDLFLQIKCPFEEIIYSHYKIHRAQSYFFYYYYWGGT